jgi:drug/metabolite transporter (DMT)-like permease
MIPYVFLGVTMFFWGTTFRAAAIGAEHTAPIMLTALRVAPAALLLLAAAIVMRRRLPSRDLVGWTVVTGLLMVTLTLEGITEGAARAGPANAAILTSASPFFILIASRFVFGERVSRIGVAGLVLGFAGGVVMVSSQLGDVENTGDFALGMAFALMTAISWAAGVLICKSLFTRRPDIDVLGFTVAQYLVGGSVLLVIAFAIEGAGSTDWGSLDLWGPIAWLAIGSSGIATLTFFGALKRLPATTVSAWQFLIPVVAVTVEIARGNVPDGIVLAGMSTAIIGVALVNAAPQLSRRIGRTRAAGPQPSTPPP